MYITKVILENFQSHKYTEIDFENGLNVIVGPSDHGKTAIIRGIKWVLYNEPAGTFFIREGEKECSVTIYFSNGVKIQRLRSASKNIYMYNEEIYEGFGTSVPLEIIEKLNIRKLFLDGKHSTSINVGEQLEGPFLLSEKPATRAKAIGRLVDVHIVDKAVKDTLRDYRNLNMDKKKSEKEIDDLEDTLKSYEYLDELKYKMSKLEKTRDLIIEKKYKLKKIRELKEKHNLVNSEINNTYVMLKKLKDIDYLATVLNEIEVIIPRYKSLLSKKKVFIKTEAEIKKMISQNKALSKIYKIDSSIDILNKLIKKQDFISSLNNKYKENVQLINRNRSYLDKLKHIDKLYKDSEILHRYILKYKEFKELNAKFKLIKNNINKGQNYIKKFDDIYIVDDIVEKIHKNISLMSRYIKMRQSYQVISDNIHKNEEKLKTLRNNIESLLNNYSKLMKDMKVCPLCFNSINKEDINRILNNLK